MKIEFDDTLACYCCFEAKQYTNSGLRILFNRLLKANYEITGEFKGIVCFNETTDRRDHVEMFATIQQTCKLGWNNVFIERTKKHSKFAWKMFFLNLSHIKKIHGLYRTKIGEENEYFANKFSVMQACNIYLRTLFYYNMFNYLKTIDFSQVKAVLTYADLLPLEHVLALYANSINIPTITCQHGIFPFDMKKKEIHVLNSYKIASKYVLSWGMQSADVFGKYSEDISCIICGNPKLEKIDKYQEDVLGIVLDIPEHKSENEAMIKIVEDYAKKNGQTVKIRIHPADKEESYCLDSQISSYDRDIFDTAVVVGHTSTMLFTLMAQGREVIRYTTGESYYNLPREIEFGDVDSLEKIMTKLKEIDYNMLSKKYILCIGNESKQLYSTFFDKLENE